MATMLSTQTDYNELIQNDRISGRVYYDAASSAKNSKNLVSRMDICRA